MQGFPDPGSASSSRPSGTHGLVCVAKCLYGFEGEVSILRNVTLHFFRFHGFWEVSLARRRGEEYLNVPIHHVSTSSFRFRP